MRRISLRSLVLPALLAAVAVGCSEDTSETTLSPTAVAANGGNEKTGTLPEKAAPEAKINKLINALFPQPEKGDAHQLVGEIKDALDEGDTAAAQDAMFELLALLLGTDLNEPSDISKAEAVAQLTDLLFDFVGLQAPDIDPGLLADIEDGTVDGVVAVIHGDEDDVIVTPGTDMGGGQIGNTALLVPDEALPDDEDYLLVVQEVGSPCANTVFEQLPLCYEYETFPSPAVFTGLAEAKVAVCVDADPRDPELIQDSDGVVEVLPPRTHSDLSGFRCDPRGILVAAADDQANPLLQLARAIARPVTHLFDPPPLVAIDVGGMAGSIGSIDTRYVGVIPQKLETVSGDGQTAAPGSTLSPLVVRVSNPHSGAPVVGVNVTFTVTGGGGSLSAATVPTDANGEASTTLTLGTAAGTNTVEASAPGTNLTGDPADPTGSVVFTATASTGGAPGAFGAPSGIDGVLSPGEWDSAVTFTFNVNLPEGGTTPATLYVMNDQTDLYFALEFARSSADPGNSFNIEFDKGGSGFTDVFVVNPSLSPAFRDNYRTLTSSPSDVSDGGTNDGSAAFLNNGQTNVYEAAHPFNSADDAHDLNLAVGDQVGIQAFVRMIEANAGPYPSGYGDTTWPGFGQFQQVTIATSQPVQ